MWPEVLSHEPCRGDPLPQTGGRGVGWCRGVTFQSKVGAAGREAVGQLGRAFAEGGGLSLGWALTSAHLFAPCFPFLYGPSSALTLTLGVPPPTDFLQCSCSTLSAQQTGQGTPGSDGQGHLALLVLQMLQPHSTATKPPGSAAHTWVVSMWQGTSCHPDRAHSQLSGKHLGPRTHLGATRAGLLDLGLPRTRSLTTCS